MISVPQTRSSFLLILLGWLPTDLSVKKFWNPFLPHCRRKGWFIQMGVAIGNWSMGLVHLVNAKWNRSNSLFGDTIDGNVTMLFAFYKTWRLKRIVVVDLQQFNCKSCPLIGFKHYPTHLIRFVPFWLTIPRAKTTLGSLRKTLAVPNRYNSTISFLCLNLFGICTCHEELQKISAKFNIWILYYLYTKILQYFLKDPS